MKIIVSLNPSPHFNIAAEEYLFNTSDEYFFVYINSSSVIIGKHQNAFAEVNTDFCEANGIPVIRRKSGGGTVYHDEGNINFCFIRNMEEGEKERFKTLTRPVMECLRKQGLSPEYSRRSDLLINGKKFSGNAEHIRKNRVLHHGTVLFSADMEKLASVLKKEDAAFSGYAVKSVRSEVINLSDLLPGKSVHDIIQLLLETVKEDYPGATDCTFSPEDEKAISALAEMRYGCRDWNFGYSPGFTLCRSVQSGNTTVSSEVRVERGSIVSVKFSGIPREQDAAALLMKLAGIRYRKKEVADVLEGQDWQWFKEFLPEQEMMKLIF
jgi:lipoate-protein ligase A